MDKRTTFWNSFLLGFFFGAAGLYFLGTKEGRKKAKEILELLEEKEEILEKLEKTLSSIKENSSSVGSLLQRLDSKANI